MNSTRHYTFKTMTLTNHRGLEGGGERGHRPRPFTRTARSTPSKRSRTYPHANLIAACSDITVRLAPSGRRDMATRMPATRGARLGTSRARPVPRDAPKHRCAPSFFLSFLHNLLRHLPYHRPALDIHIGTPGRPCTCLIAATTGLDRTDTKTRTRPPFSDRVTPAHASRPRIRSMSDSASHSTSLSSLHP